MALKKSFYRDLGISILGSAIATFLTQTSILDVPWRVFLSEARLIQSIIIFILFLTIFIGCFWVNSTFKYINRALVHIRETGTHFLNDTLIHGDNEDTFDQSCQERIQTILQTCVAAVGLKPKISAKKIAAFAAVFLVQNDNLVFHSFYTKNGNLGLKRGDAITGNHYFASWVLDEEKTRFFNKKRGREQFGGDLVLIEEFPPIEKVSPKALPIRSGIAVALRSQGKVIGVLIVASHEKNCFAKEDVFPVGAVANYLVVTLSHMRDFCPWHRKGWRDERFERNIKVKEFVFSPIDYNLTYELRTSLSNVPCATLPSEVNKNEVIDNFKALCNNISRLKHIKSVYLIGTFNGWNKTKNPLFKDRGDPDLKWRCNVHLPQGEYRYQFRILTDDNEYFMFDPKSSLWLDSSCRLQSNFKVW